MTQLTSLLWKEWREARPYLFIGLGLFLGMPAIKSAQDAAHTNYHLGFGASLWVVPLGGVLAVFVAVGVTTRDLRPRLEDFWRSRPIGVTRWLAAKYATALAVVLVACGLPLLVELAVDRPTDTAAGSLLAFFPFYWTAIFSLAFLAGCLIARPAHAATLGLAAMLLIYTLPIVLPPLAWMNVAEFIDFRPTGSDPWTRWPHLWGRQQLGFAGGMLGVTAFCGVAAIVAVRRGWRIDSGRKLMHGLVATAFLLLFASAAFQLGTNLPVLQQFELRPGEQVQAIQLNSAGSGGQIVTMVWPYRPHLATPSSRADDPERWSRTFEVRPTGLVIGPAVSSDYGAINGVLYPPTPLVATRDNVACGVMGDAPSTNDVNNLSLSLSMPNADGTATVRPATKLWAQPWNHPDAQVYRWGDTLYVVGDRLDAFDVSRPDRPRLLSDAPNGQPPGHRIYGSRAGGPLVVHLITLPGMPPQERVKATLEVESNHPSFDGTLLCMRVGPKGATLAGYRLAHLDDQMATFDRIGDYRPTLLQQWVNDFEFGQFTLSDGRVYIDGFGNTGRTFSSAVTILDTRGPRPMREVGHFAAPGAEMIRPLPDGRAIVGGGNHLWLVGAPPRH